MGMVKGNEMVCCLAGGVGMGRWLNLVGVRGIGWNMAESVVNGMRVLMLKVDDSVVSFCTGLPAKNAVVVVDDSVLVFDRCGGQTE